MKSLYELKEKLWEELEEISRKPEMGAGDLELAHKLTDTIKNIDKICALEEQGSYSEAGDYEDGSYAGGASYANRGKHYVRGHYSRESGSYSNGRSNRGGNGGGYSSRRGGGRGGYSRDDGREEMIEHVRMAIDTAPDEYKEDIKSFLRELEQ